MTRDKEIDNAKNAFYERILEDGYYYDPRDCFEKGADWADANPKSPWKSVNDDLPCNHPELITCESSVYSEVTTAVVAVIHGFIIMSKMYKEDDKWHWENDEPTHWFPIPDPPKE